MQGRPLVFSLPFYPLNENGCVACSCYWALVGDAVEKQKSQIGDTRKNDPPSPKSLTSQLHNRRIW